MSLPRADLYDLCRRINANGCHCESAGRRSCDALEPLLKAGGGNPECAAALEAKRLKHGLRGQIGGSATAYHLRD